MMLAGLTGGLACGKSFVAGALRELGCYVVEADALGHEVMQPGGPAWLPIVQAFGSGVLSEDGRIDRSRLAALAFSDPAELARLTAIVHPAVEERAQRRFREIAANDPDAIVVYVAAILIETGIHRQFAKVILVTCSREQQIERALLRPGATEEDVLARLQRQLPPEEKRKFADYIVDTSGTREETLRQTKMVFEDLKLAS
ncbi:MAG: dephospho-CoA kinase [Acidobacteriota bacterium]